LSRPERQPEIRELPEQLPLRTRDRDLDDREHKLTLPSGANRELVRDEGREYHLRGSEVDLLERAARFRSVFTEDLERASGGDHRFREDVRSLERQGLVEEHTVTRLRDGRVADVIAVTEAGKTLLDHHRDPEHDDSQTYYGGWVKPAEIWHDASLFRMCREVESEIERDSGRVRRVILDDELKARAYRALHEVRDRPDAGADAHRAVAATQGLHLEDGRFVFPDVRLEVEDREGTVRTVDLELVTEHYHRGHLGGKAGPGFRMFRGGSSGSRGGAPRDEHTTKRLLK
jgi:DNA-binding PadR family transcriptional regulator